MKKGIYSTEDTKIMMLTQASRNQSRLQELIDFMRLSGYKKIGIANCLSKQKEAQKLIHILQQYDFEIYTINCKDSGLTGSDICNEISGICCDPISQADYLNSKNCEFNIIVGLCLGHSLLFEKHSQAPTTPLLIKGTVNL